MSKMIRVLLANKVLVITVAFMVAVVTFITSVSVVTGAQERTKEQEREIRELAEEQYVETVRAFLEEQGYHYSGVNLTMVWDEENGVHYSVSVHNDKINRKSDEQKKELISGLSSLNYNMECKGIQVDFLE